MVKPPRYCLTYVYGVFEVILQEVHLHCLFSVDSILSLTSSLQVVFQYCFNFSRKSKLFKPPFFENPLRDSSHIVWAFDHCFIRSIFSLAQYLPSSLCPLMTRQDHMLDVL